MSESRGRWDTTLVRPSRGARRMRPVVRPHEPLAGAGVDRAAGLVAERKGDWSELPFDTPSDPSSQRPDEDAPVPDGDAPVPDGDTGQGADRGDDRAVPGDPARDADASGGPAAGLKDPADGYREALVQISALVHQLVDIDLEELDDQDLRQLLRRLQPPIARLQAFRTRAAGELEARAVTSAEPGREQRAEQDSRRWLRTQLGLTPGEAKQAGTVGRQMREMPELAAAHAAARISEAHTRVIAETMSWLPATLPKSRRERFEAQLIALAEELDVIAFGRKARRFLAEIDLAAAEHRERRQHERRSMTIGDAEDGAVVGSFRLYGLQAEKLRTALDAARHRDPAEGPFRTTEQRNADALEVLCDLALRSSSLPTQHGVRPHVSVIVEWSALAIGAGVAELDFTGPITMASLRPLLRDSTVSRVILDPDSVPIEAGEAVRTVPAGIFRQLAIRDRGCSWEDCDAPVAWCEVAHGQIPFRSGGRLRLDDCALLCSRHHRIFDNQPWRLVIRGPAVHYERPDG
jgi:hypothetical protein